MRRRRIVLSLVFAAWGVPVVWLSILPAALRAGFLRATIEAKAGEALGFPVTIGTLDLPNAREVVAGRVRLAPAVPGLAPVEIDRVRVRLSSVFGGVKDVAVDGVRATLDISPDRLRELARPRPAPDVPTSPLRLAGPLPLPPLRVRGITIEGRCGGQPLEIVDGEIRVDPATPFVIPFAVSGRLTTSPDPAIDIRGTLELTDTTGRVRLDRFKIATLAASVGLDVPGPDAAAAHVKLESFKLPSALVALLEGFTGMRARGLVTTSCTLDLARGTLAKLEVEGELAGGELSGVGVTIKHREGRTKVAVAVTPHPDGGWRAAGTIADLEIDIGGGSVVHFPQAAYDARVDGRRATGHVRFDDAFAASADLESSKVAGEVGFDMTRDGSVVEGSVVLTLRRAEVLKGEMYAEIDRATTVELTLAGRFDLGRAEYEFKGTGVSMAGLGRASIDGRARRTPNGLAYDVAVETGEVALAALGERLAGIFSIKLALDGTLRAKAKLTGEATDYALDARVTLADVTARLDSASVTKLHGEVPVLLGGAEREARGAVEFENVAPIPEIALGRQRLELVARPGELASPSAIAFDVLGGRARVSELRASELAGSPRIDLKAAADDVDLAVVAKVLKLGRPLTGRAWLAEQRVLVSKPVITLTGGARASVFEGEAKLEHMRVLAPLDPVHRAVRTSFSMTGIRLRRVCETLTEFGLIDGVAAIEGQVELHTSGLPNWMQLTLRTVPTRGVDQLCDVQAVKALATIIAGPEMASALRLSPTERLHYERFGFFAAMDYDLTLYPRGLWFKRADGTFVDSDLEALRKGKRPTERGTEFIMVGTGRTQININIVNPGGGIDFNDILERFKAVSEK